MRILPPCNPDLAGREFRVTVLKGKAAQKQTIRIVPAFTIQALQKNTKIKPPAKTNVYDAEPLKVSAFQIAYLRAEVPAYIQFTRSGQRLAWHVPVTDLDYHHYLPLFLTGLSEGVYPFNFIVEHAIDDLVKLGAHKIKACIPEIITPLSDAYRTKRTGVITYANKCMQIMAKGCPGFGEAFVPFYRQILPHMNLFICKRLPVQTNFDTIIVREDDLVYSIEDTLNVLEKYGGPDAFINIKYYIPLYESCTQN